MQMQISPKSKLWLKSFLAMIAGGAVTSALPVFYQSTMGGAISLKQVGLAALGGAFATLSAYLTQSPVRGGLKSPQSIQAVPAPLLTFNPEALKDLSALGRHSDDPAIQIPSENIKSPE